MLSIVIIGKNEASNLARLGESIKALKATCDFPVESIFVDSASTDESVEIGRHVFDRTIELAPSDLLCASSGRYVGTLEARFPWVFYIDGDMEICEPFFAVIRHLDEIEDECVGIVGVYVHRFDNGTSALQGFAGGIVKSDWAAYFGGAVILRRSAVLNAGNWNPGIFGKEEMELYARLGDGNRVVRYINVPMVYHYSDYLTPMELLLRLLYPGGGQGKVFYGFGQSIRALYIKGKLGALVRLDFEPYLFWALLILGLLLAIVLPMKWGITFLVAELLFLSIWMRPGSIVRYFSLIFSLLTGWAKYTPFFRPLLKQWFAGNQQAA